MADDKQEAAKAVTIAFRIAALVLVVAATVVMGTASQLVVVDGGRRGWYSSHVVSYRHYNALVYFVAAGVITAVCSAAGLYLSAVNAKPGGAGALIPLLDVLAQGFLFSAAGAAFASRGNAWTTGNGGGGEGGSACDAASPFCGRVTIAAVVGTAAALAVTVAALASKGWGLRRRCCDL